MSNRIGKILSFILRHDPEQFKLTMDEFGWVDVNALMDVLVLNLPTLISVVNADDKGRYEFNEDLSKIRAVQGHSRPVKIDLKPLESIKDYVYHGTTQRFLDSILEEGLLPQSRTYVHLSESYDTALQVGSRHGRVVVLQVDYKQMLQDGIKLYTANNNVILTNYVPPKYLKVLE